MLSIWIGRAGSGKSEKVLRTIAAERTQRAQVLIVPEHTSHRAEVDLCRACGETASRNAEVLSFQNLATRVLSRTGGLADVTLDGGGKLLTMRLALQELSGQLKVFHHPSQRAAFLQQLVELAEEFYAYEIRPEELYEKTQEIGGAMGDKLQSVALLFGAYDAKLHAGGRDARSRVEKLRDALGSSQYLAGKDVYVDGYAYFNRLEEDILSIILRQAHQVTVTLLGEKGNQELFQNALRQRERLVRMAREVGVPCEICWFTAQERTALDRLERCFFGSDEVWPEPTEQIALYEAATAYSEAEYVAAQIREMVRSGKYRYRDIAVAARNMDRYGPILENALRRAEISAYQARRHDILEKSVITLLLGAVDAVTGGLEYEDMFRYLKTGLAGITPAECDLLENYVILWQIRGSMWLRETPWTANPDGYGAEMTDARQARLDEINRIREKVRGPLTQLSDGLKTCRTARGKAEALYTFAQRSGAAQTLQQQATEQMACGEVQLAEESAQLWQIFCDVLDQFVEILGGQEIGGEEFARLLRLVLTQYSVGTIPATLDQVRVSEITRNDRHRVKCLFLLGAGDDVLPTVERRGGVLDDEDRETLQQHDIELSNATFDALDNELQNIYAALTQPTEYLHVSWPAGDLAGSQLRPSFVVERIRRLFPSVPVTRETGDYRLLTPAGALEAAGEHPGGALWQSFAQSGRWGAALETMRRARSFDRGRLSPEAVRALYGSFYRMSASRMDKLRSCHFGYFMQYGLCAKERKAAGFDAPEIGTFLHYLLENVNREVKARGGYGAVERAALRGLVRQYLEKYSEEQLGGCREKSARFRYLFSRLRTTAYAIVENVADELSQSDFVPLEFELGFGGRDGQLPAITIREGESTLAVTGKVDRVDGWLRDGKLYIRVVDYKTGKKSFDLTDLRYGLGVQMLLYLFALEGEGERYFGHPVVPAGVLYTPARDVILRTERGVTEEKIRAALDKELRRSGMVLAEPEVLQAMEHSALEKPCFLPIEVKKGGTITGGLASAAQLGKLGQYVERLLHEITDELSSGNINADPCSRSPQESSCDWCEYASACCFEEGRDRRRMMKKVRDSEFWRFIEQETEEVRHG